MNSNIFSIEIFIDRIRLLEGERCYFPSTILKLLNYEPTLLSTINNEIQIRFREYLDFIEKSNEIHKVCQLNELKDIDGNYLVRKGKSILFEANTLSLISEFNTLPLYILICDDYFNPNHLVGVVTIKLSNVMVSLAQKITECHHTVSEDVMGKFPVLNLMGDAVGIMTLKLRLIFIGANLVPHLPQENEIEIKPKTKLINGIEKSVGCDPTIPIKSNYVDSIEGNATSITAIRSIGCQANEFKNVRVQIASKECTDEFQVAPKNLANIGLTIDPNDPVLGGTAPPMIYNRYFGNWSDSESQCEEIPVSSNQNKPSLQATTKSTDKLPILNALFNELKSWKSQDNVHNEVSTPRILEKPQSRVQNKGKNVKIVGRSQSENNQPKIQDNKEFIQRMSKPKRRPASPSGMVPRNKGWLRIEPEYCGPLRSCLKYKLTKTQVQRIELNCDKSSIRERPCKDVMDNHRAHSSHEIAIHQQVNSSFESTSPLHTPVPRTKRNPIVPPLFGTGTSISAPSFSMSRSTDNVNPKSKKNEQSRNGNHKRPPKSPGTNNNNRSFSYDTNETMNEADQYLNLNPVQSNRSPHMSHRSVTVLRLEPEPSSDESNNEDEYDYRNHRRYRERANGKNRSSRRHVHKPQEQYRSESVSERNNQPEDYSDEFNQTYSSDGVTERSPNRLHSNASPISQTSEWRTEYSFHSSQSQNDKSHDERSSRSPDLGTHRSPPRSTAKPRRSLLSNTVMPGGRFYEGTGSGSVRTFETNKPSFNESLEISNFGSSDLDINPSLVRPGSAGADVTSFTKVTKYDRSLAPGHPNSNYLGTNLVASTVGSLRTDDSQVLTSGSYC